MTQGRLPSQQDNQPKSSQKSWQLRATVAVGIVVIVIGITYIFTSTTPERVACTTSEKPSIAVLPFMHLSNDTELKIISDSMAENLRIASSDAPFLLIVKDLDYLFPYHRTVIDTEQLAEQWCVRYLLEGSVRGVGDQVRINVQLIDLTTGNMVWAERYQGSLNDVLSNYDEDVHQIVAALSELTLVSQL